MNTVQKLQLGDEIRIIAPSRSMSILSEEGIAKAKETLQSLGYIVTFGKHVFECDIQQSSSIASRLEDLHDAFADQHVKAILTAIGGFNCNELLPYIDYELLRANPKILCGYSDITALTNAITAHCHFITYSGPHFSSFQMEELQTYQSHFFSACVANDQPFVLAPSPTWTDDEWYLRNAIRNHRDARWKVYTEGNASGTLFGGNLCTLNLLQGTPHMPKLDNCILFIEDDYEVNAVTFARDLTSLLQHVPSIKGLLIGRFQQASKMTEEQLHFILHKHPQLQHIPVMYDIDFGHTQPIVTMPIGGHVRIDSTTQQIELITF